MDETFQGGCYCRAVRFEVSDILMRVIAIARNVVGLVERRQSFLFGRYRVAPTNQQDFVSFSPFTLDNPEAVRPTVHIWCSSKTSYFETTDKLPRFPEGTISHPSKRPSWRAERPDNAEAAGH